MKNIINIIVIGLVMVSCQKDFYLEDLQDTQALLEQLRVNNTNLTDRLSDLQSQFNDLEVENSDLQSMLDRAQEEIDNLTSIEDASEEEIEVIEEIIEEIEVMVEEIASGDGFTRYYFADYIVDTRDVDNFTVQSVEVHNDIPFGTEHNGTLYQSHTVYTNGIQTTYTHRTRVQEYRIGHGIYGSDISMNNSIDDYVEIIEIDVHTSTDIIGREVEIWETTSDGTRVRLVHKGLSSSRILQLPFSDLFFTVTGGEITDQYLDIATWIGNEDFWEIKTDSDIKYRTSSEGLIPINNAVFYKYDTFRPVLTIEGETPLVNPLPKFSNIQVEQSAETFFNWDFIEVRLTEIENIMSVEPQFLPMLYSNNIQYTTVGHNGSTYRRDLTDIGLGHAYFKRPIIHELAHAYHDQVLPNGDNNQEIIDMFNSISHDTSVRYGDEGNAYWRRNKHEFFAEILTTYIYVKANQQGIKTDFPNPISQVDSAFYNNVIEPYFDNLFN